MAGKPETDDVPILVTSTDEDAAIQLPSLSSKASRRRRRRRRKKESLRPEDVRQRVTVSDDVTVVVDKAADTSSSGNCTSKREHATQGENKQDATAETTAQASRHNFTTGRIEFEVPSELKCSVTLMTFGEWVQVVKDNPHMIYYCDDVSRSPLVPNSILQRPVTNTAATQTVTQIDEDEYVTCAETLDTMSQLDGICDHDGARPRQLSWQRALHQFYNAREAEYVQQEQLQIEVQWRLVDYNQWALYGDDCVMIFRRNPFTRGPLEMRYDVNIQQRVHGILTKLYTKEQLLNSVGDVRQVEGLYQDVERHGSRKQGWERLMELPPQTPSNSIHTSVMREVEFDMILQDKYLGGAYNQSFLRCSDELWSMYLEAYENALRNQRLRQQSES